MTSKANLEPGKRESRSRVASIQVKAGHPDGPDTEALIMRLTDERDTLQTENAQLRHQLAEGGESKAHS